MRSAVLVVLAALPCGPARAEPESCKSLAVQKVAQFSTYARNRFANAESWENRKVDWKTMDVTVFVDRAPHIARKALEACPGVVVKAVDPHDAKRQSSLASITVTSFALLSRLAQLPAVHQIYVRDPRMHRFDFEGVDLE